ncbi:hypothetical protein CCO03_08755 [Comamonas serinivorans]|uniref:Uncharacterized protein n=1 Tax=Comamonas serinivorans TaxID=1082851 RepID=A0A1Y0EM76_9BURK|nr:hypothetical protein [Comamonas serinivorans]ARU04755.1 hypothetical protein CCO03_08755 [Comamonas serinivorans]
MKAAIETVAEAAIAWNRARLHRIAVARSVPSLAIGYSEQEHQLRLAKKAEAQAKAYLRKICAKADPTCVVLEADVRAPRLRLLDAQIIDI